MTILNKISNQYENINTSLGAFGNDCKLFTLGIL